MEENDWKTSVNIVDCAVYRHMIEYAITTMSSLTLQTCYYVQYIKSIARLCFYSAFLSYNMPSLKVYDRHANWIFV